MESNASAFEAGRQVGFKQGYSKAHSEMDKMIRDAHNGNVDDMANVVVYDKLPQGMQVFEMDSGKLATIISGTKPETEKDFIQKWGEITAFAVIGVALFGVVLFLLWAFGVIR